MIKLLGVAVSLVLALALLGAVPASATTFQIKSCLKEGKACKTSSVGTTIEAKSVITFKEEEKTENECTLALTAKVTDPTTEKAGDNMALSVTKAVFSGCSSTGVEAEGLPWAVEADATEFEENGGALEMFDFKYTSFFGCKYEVIGEPDTMLSYFVSTPSYWLILEVGSVLEPEFSAFCWPLLNLRYDPVTPLLNDPGYASANTLVVG